MFLMISAGQDGNSMRGIFATHAYDRRQQLRADVLQANQADAGDRMTFVQLRTESGQADGAA